MNLINSKIACRLGNPWACDRCHSTKPPPPAPILATCDDLRLPQNLQKTPSTFRASHFKAAAPPNPNQFLLALAFCSIPMSRSKICEEEVSIAKVLSWSLKKEVPRDTAHVPTHLSPALGRPSSRHTCQIAPMASLPSHSGPM